MITLQNKPMLAALLSALALSVASPAQAQRTVPDGVSAPIDAVTLTPAGMADPAGAQALDTALQAYERCHWAVAFEQLVRLAERDHAQAASVALQMHRYGPALYGQVFVLSPSQVARLAQVRLHPQTAQAARAP